MKVIIRGKRYDTEAPQTEMVAEAHSVGLSMSDFRWWEEELYRTARGNWFIHGRGGAMTRWSQPVGDMTGGGEGILPLDPEGAKAWLERHKCSDELEEYFGEELEDA